MVYYLVFNLVHQPSKPLLFKISTMSQIIIPRPKIELKRDQHGQTYFLIHDPQTNTAYFAFSGQVKKGWYDLALKWTKAKMVLINSVKEKKVISLRVLTRKEQRKYDYLRRLAKQVYPNPPNSVLNPAK